MTKSERARVDLDKCLGTRTTRISLRRTANDKCLTNARPLVCHSGFDIDSLFVIRISSFFRRTIFAVSSSNIEGLIRAARTKREPIRGDKTAVRASRLIQSLPRYISAAARANSRSANCRSLPMIIFAIAPAASSPERTA
jgi:hypothetical protein